MNIKHVHIGYTKSLLEISDLQLENGKVYGLVGANGRGKTTLMKTLIGQISVLSGQIQVNNTEISLLSKQDKSKYFGFVNSRFAGIPYMQAREYVALGRSPYTNAFGRLSNKDEDIIDESFATLEIDHLKNKFTEELSDGERQLLAIAKVLAQETQYIFLDEPTAFLDYSNKKRVLQMLIKLAHEEDKCILFSSHDLEMVLEFSDSLITVPRDNNQLQVLKASKELEELIRVCF